MSNSSNSDERLNNSESDDGKPLTDKDAFKIDLCNRISRSPFNRIVL